MADNSLRLIDECDIVMGHIFPFSPRTGTPAARMPQVAPAVVKERARRLREASARRKREWLKGLVGTKQRVLIEKDGHGHAENFAPVLIRHSGEGRNPDDVGLDPGLRRDDGRIMDSHITSTENDTLIGSPL